MADDLAAFTVIAAVILGGLVYLLPWLIARGNGHAHAGEILLLNVVLGVTVIGWIAAFIWACLPGVGQPAPPAPSAGRAEDADDLEFRAWRLRQPDKLVRKAGWSMSHETLPPKGERPCT